MDNTRRRSIILLSLLMCAIVVFVGVVVVTFVKEDTPSVRNGNISQEEADSILRGPTEDLLSQLNTNSGTYSGTNTLPSFSDVVEMVSPAVVRIDTNTIVTSQSNGNMVIPFFGDMFEMPSQEYEQPGTGSGFIISKEGHIVTNHHVVANTTSIKVTLTDGRVFDATLVGSNEPSDIAIIKINADSDLPVAQLGNSDELRQGDWVLAIGNPYGFDHTVTSGIVSALGRNVTDSQGTTVSTAELIQTNAAINQGNSGGPLINMKGQVIGINTAIIPYAQGIGFAIAIDGVKDILNQILVYGKVMTPWVGITLMPATETLASQYNLPDSDGILVISVVEGSPAGVGGIKANDLLKRMNDMPLTSSVSLPDEVRKMNIGDRVTFEVWRGSERLNITITLGEMP